MNKLMGRIILWVLVVCFISIVICTMSTNTLRSDSLLQCSQPTPSILFVSSTVTTYNSYNGISPSYIAPATVSASQFTLNSSTLFGNLMMLVIGLAGILLLVRRLWNVTRYFKWLALSYSILVINTLITQSV